MPNSASNVHPQSPAARFNRWDVNLLSGTFSYRDAIDEALDMLDGVRVFNLAMIGTRIESDPNAENEIKWDDMKRLTTRPKHVNQYTPVYARLQVNMARQQWNTMEELSGIGDLGGLMEDFRLALVRNSAAKEVADALREMASSIRAMVPPVGGVLIRIDLYIHHIHSEEIRFTGIVIYGVGLSYYEVINPGREEIRSAPKLPKDYEQGFWQKDLGDSIFGTPPEKVWLYRPIWLWVGTNFDGGACHLDTPPVIR